MEEDTNDEESEDEDTNDEESVDEDTNDEESVDEDELPHKFVHNSYMNLWRSEEEGLPTINFCVHHDLDSDLKNQLCIKLYVGLLKDSLAEILYQGAEACLQTSIEASQKLDVAFEISGFKEKMLDYISKIWKRFISFSPEEISFQRMKEVVANHMSNCNSDIQKHSDNLMLQCITKSCYDVDNMRKELSSIGYEQFCRFVRAMRSKMFIEGVIYGDLSKAEAVAISDLFGRVKTPLDDECVIILRGTTIKDSKVKIKTDLNSHSKVCYQIGEKSLCPRETAVVKLFEKNGSQQLIQSIKGERDSWV
ncbi:uncharacterized protein LOC9316543 [Arabidopsis lyrata subsp. lyrata]|uniref:uncharacterized protein LOC9316543 n=1 Tax=Arabidopsis lyrata subsp. lyrata TaxID=81972 RepID=UPI000A29B82E|nr:uncharacterized protein LOC9316543 [Arabidopsis lyrata subsp. lyrata]|eukprot:XP_020885744.1 uncharacterized protein LOC9316543 [Arabidopsis lyrata subsp. lyrata]